MFLQQFLHSPFEAPLSTFSCKFLHFTHLFSLYIYMRVEHWAKHMGVNLRCYWEYLGGTTWGTWWEQIGNEETKQTISHPP
jgi:hypothetical protein